jgi:hypothetical protein
MPSATRTKPSRPASAARTPVRSAARPVKPVKTVKSLEPPLSSLLAAAPKHERLKIVRDSFTMPKPDFELIGTLKQRALVMGREVKKSELLRAGLRSLAALPGPAFLSAVEAVPRLKTGRPHQK